MSSMQHAVNRDHTQGHQFTAVLCSAHHIYLSLPMSISPLSGFITINDIFTGISRYTFITTTYASRLG